MKKPLLPLLAALVFAAGCASAQHAARIPDNIPPAPGGQTAVFGKVVLLNTVNGLSMPVDDLEASLCLYDDASKKAYSLCTSASGDFGVYLPPGRYRAVAITTQGFKFIPDLEVTIPGGVKAVYTGTIIMDGQPDGVIPGTVNTSMLYKAKRLLLGAVDTRFVYQVRDDQAEFEAGLRKAAPAAEVKFTKALFEPSGGVADGSYPKKLNAEQNVVVSVKAGDRALEDLAGTGIITLPYLLNPLIFIGIP